MNIAIRLKALREEYKITQSELAKETRIKQQNISRWEAGIHIPNIEDCIKIADYYKITLDELVDRDI